MLTQSNQEWLDQLRGDGGDAQQEQALTSNPNQRTKIPEQAPVHKESGNVARSTKGCGTIT